MDQFVVKRWLDQWRQCAELLDLDVPRSLHDDLVEPFRVFQLFLASFYYFGRKETQCFREALPRS